MSNRSALLVILVAGFFSATAQARELDLTSEKFAPYIRGEYQTWGKKQSTFDTSSGTGNSFKGEIPFLSNYEFGFVYSIREVSLRFGFEVIYPATVKGISATNAAGTELFTLDSDVSAYVPRLGLDINIKNWQRSRIFLNATYGIANLTVQNSYGFTTDGSAAYPGMTDFREETKATAPLTEVSLGWEFSAFDTTTIVLDAGYRALKFDSLTHNVPVTSFQGAVGKGDKALDTNGVARKLDLSGPFASLQFRFWVF